MYVSVCGQIQVTKLMAYSAIAKDDFMPLHFCFNVLFGGNYMQGLYHRSYWACFFSVVVARCLDLYLQVDPPFPDLQDSQITSSAASRRRRRRPLTSYSSEKKLLTGTSTRLTNLRSPKFVKIYDKKIPLNVRHTFI